MQIVDFIDIFFIPSKKVQFIPVYSLIPIYIFLTHVFHHTLKLLAYILIKLFEFGVKDASLWISRIAKYIFLGEPPLATATECELNRNGDVNSKNILIFLNFQITILIPYDALNFWFDHNLIFLFRIQKEVLFYLIIFLPRKIPHNCLIGFEPPILVHL